LDSVRTWPALDVQPVSDRLQGALTDYDVSAIDERSAELWRVFFTSDAERDRARSAFRDQFRELTVLEPVDVADEDWAARSQASLRAVRVGGIIVAPPWNVPEEAADPPAITIVIRPSMGFGTGHHATTRLCLAALQRLDLRSRSVLDAGTGSGVLALAASLLGAGRVVAIDDDADAIAAARDNLELNKRASVMLTVGDFRSADLSTADVVVANLTGGLLQAAAPRLLNLATARGFFVLSGLTLGEEGDVLAAFPGRMVEHREEEDEWLCLTLR